MHRSLAKDLLTTRSSETDVLEKAVDETYSIAAACKIDLSTVEFASSASASSFANGEGGAEKVEIKGSDSSGQQADYGMYLKTKGTNTDFNVLRMFLDEGILNVGYMDGTKGQSIMVHAFKADSLTENTTSYVAALPINNEQDKVSLNVSSAWGISSAADLKGYTIKVWMEDSSSLAAATTPETFYGTGERISASGGKEEKNLRVFATKDQLQCSWGTLKNVDDSVGENPTNQKIYFGAKDGTPLQFWIAGRENDSAEIDNNGQIMTLYQAKSVEEKIFNHIPLESGSDPDGGGIAPNSSGLRDDILIQAKYGQTLGDLGFDFDKEIGKLKDIDGNILEGFWSWKDGDDTKVGEVGEHTFIAVFKPADNNYNSVEVNVTVNVSVDKSGWGEEEKDSPEILLDKPTETQSPSENPSDYSSKFFSTGDNITNFTIYALGLTMIVLLGILMITSYRRRSEK